MSSRCLQTLIFKNEQNVSDTWAIYSHIQEEQWRHTKGHLDVCSPNKLLINRTSLAELSRRENIKMHKRQTRDPHDFTSAPGNNVTV